MKNTLKNEKTTIDVKSGSSEKTTYAGLAIACIKSIPQTGLDVVEMSARMDVLKKLEKGGSEIKMERAETETLKKCASEMRWTLLHDDVIKFLNVVEKL